MQEFEIWVDVEWRSEGQREVVCALFSRKPFHVRPVAGERLSFQPRKGTQSEFRVAVAWGAMPANHVSVEVEDVSHYCTPGAAFTSALRCSPLLVPSLADAKAAVAFLCEQHGFEVDPYGVNQLQEPGAGGA